MSHWVETATPVKFFIICWHYFYSFLDLKPVALVKLLRESPLSWLLTKYWWIWEFYNFQPIFCCCLSACFADSHGNVISDVWYCSNYWHPVISIVYSNWLIMILVWFVTMWLKLIGWLCWHWVFGAWWSVCWRSAAPKLKDVSVDGSKARELYLECIQLMRTMYHACHLIHADLSEFNLLWEETAFFASSLPLLLSCWQHKGSLIRCLKSPVVDEERMGRPRSIKAASYVPSRVWWWMKRGWGGLAS